jgi:hypothetical protein
MSIINKEEIMTNSIECDGMTFKQFIEFNKIELDKTFSDKLFHSIIDDMPIYMDNTMIEFVGYSGTTVQQKQEVSKFLKNNFTEHESKLYWKYSNTEYAKHLESLSVKCLQKIYPVVPTGKNSSKTNHILIKPKLFKLMLLFANTEKSKRVKRYLIDLEEAIFLYIKYQCESNKLNYKKELQELFSKKYTREQSIKELEGVIEKKYRIGCVYFIQELDSQNVKIGWCWNLARRMTCLQVGNSQTLSVVKCILTQFPYEKEQALHLRFNKYVVRGEWYSHMVLN